MKNLLRATACMAVLIALPGHATEDAPGKPTKVTAILGVDGIQRQQVDVGNYYYRPNHIVAKVGKPLELLFVVADGITKHSFNIKAPDAGMNISMEFRKDRDVVKFTPTKVGVYRFYCDTRFMSLKRHDEQGEEGVIEIIE